MVDDSWVLPEIYDYGPVLVDLKSTVYFIDRKFCNN